MFINVYVASFQRFVTYCTASNIQITDDCRIIIRRKILGHVLGKETAVWAAEAGRAGRADKGLVEHDAPLPYYSTVTCYDVT